METYSPFKSFKTKLTNFIKTQIGFIFLIFLFLFILMPIFIYKCIIKWVAKQFKKELGEMLTEDCAILAHDNMYTRPSCTLVPALTFDGELNAESLSNNLRDLTNMERFSKLKQVLSSWMGFYFWKNAGTFKFERHWCHNAERISKEEITNLQVKLALKPYVKNQPLWSMILLTNVISPEHPEKRQSVLLARFHHCLADGFSLVQALGIIIKSDLLESVPQPSSNRLNLSDKIIVFLETLFLGPYNLVKSAVEMDGPSPWKIPPYKTDRMYSFHSNSELVFKDVVSIARTLGVTTPALLFAAYAGGVRNIMLEQGVEIPEKFVAMYPLAVPGIAHPGNLTNHFTVISLEVPLLEKNSLKRLYKVNDMFMELRTSTIPYVTYLFKDMASPIVGLISSRITIGSACLTNFPGPRKCLKFEGIQLIDFDLNGGIPFGNVSSGFTTHTFAGKICMKAGFDTCLYSDPKIAQRKIELILNEIKLFKKAADELDLN